MNHALDEVNIALQRCAPFKATVFFLTELIAASGMTVLPPLRTGATLTSSHSMGTCSGLSKILQTPQSPRTLAAE